MLQAHTIRPNRGFGQNFLVDHNVVQKLVSAADIQSEDVVLEIGPGIGILTKELAVRAAKVVAIEKDKKLVEVLEGLTVGMEHVEIIHADALKLDPSDIPTLRHSYKLVSNLPYYITAPTIRKFLEAENQAQSITLIIQKEVAQRICAKPPGMSIFAASVQFYATAKIIAAVKKSAFWPQPKVDSAIIHIVPHKRPEVDIKKFFKIVKSGFAHPRKQLAGNLSGGLHMSKENITTVLKKNNIQPVQRAETLSIQDWLNITNSL